MIIKRIVWTLIPGLLLLAVAATAESAPFLVTEPFPVDAVLPEQCVLQESGVPEKITPLYTDAAGQKRCQWDLAGYQGFLYQFMMVSRKAGVPDSAGTPATCDLRSPTPPPQATLLPALP